jgi:hypothetical protein
MYEEGGTVSFEYTLKVVYDWEFKWRKPFLKGGLTDEETVDFYKRMALDPIEEKFLTRDVMNLLAKYIQDEATATVFSTADEGQNGSNVPIKGKVYTSEEIYSLMFSAHVPIEFENRNLNRLMTILRITASHNEPPKQMAKADIARQNRELNEQRRKKFNTKG